MIDDRLLTIVSSLYRPLRLFKLLDKKCEPITMTVPRKVSTDQTFTLVEGYRRVSGPGMRKKMRGRIIFLFIMHLKKKVEIWRIKSILWSLKSSQRSELPDHLVSADTLFFQFQPPRMQPPPPDTDDYTAFMS